jgi:hypothetical protein
MRTGAMHRSQQVPARCIDAPQPGQIDSQLSVPQSFLGAEPARLELVDAGTGQAALEFQHQLAI